MRFSEGMTQIGGPFCCLDSLVPVGALTRTRDIWGSMTEGNLLRSFRGDKDTLNAIADWVDGRVEFSQAEIAGVISGLGYSPNEPLKPKVKEALEAVARRYNIDTKIEK